MLFYFTKVYSRQSQTSKVFVLNCNYFNVNLFADVTALNLDQALV